MKLLNKLFDTILDNFICNFICGIAIIVGCGGFAALPFIWAAYWTHRADLQDEAVKICIHKADGEPTKSRICTEMWK